MFSDHHQDSDAQPKLPRPFSPIAVWAETFGYLFRHFGSIVVAAIPAIIVLVILGGGFLNWMTGGQLLAVFSGETTDLANTRLNPVGDPMGVMGSVFALFGVLLLSFSIFAVPITRHIFAGRKVTVLSGLSFNTLRYLVMSVLVGVVVMVIIMLVSMVTLVPLMAVVSGGVEDDLSAMGEMMLPMIFIGLLMNVVFVLIVARFMFVPTAAAVKNETNALSGWEVVTGNYWRVVVAALLVGATWLVLEVGVVTAAFTLAGKMSPLEVMLDILGANGDSADFFSLGMELNEGALWPNYVQMFMGMLEIVVLVIFAAVSYRRLVDAMPDG